MKKRVIKNEKQFANWFRKNYRELGYSKIIRGDISKCPDFIMLKKGKEVRVELETVSSNFIAHKHSYGDVDEIVCLVKDIELKKPVKVVNELKYEGNIKVTLSLDSKIYDGFQKYCNDNAFIFSKKIELLIKEFLSNKNNKKISLFFILFGMFFISLVGATTIFSDDFEDGGIADWNLTAVSGANNWTASSTNPFNGLWHAQSQPQSTTEPASVMEMNVSTQGFNNINFSYYRRLIALDAADEFQVEWFNGTSWIVLEQTGGASADDASYLLRSFNLSNVGNNNSNLRIKFECTAGAVSEFCRVDNVTITGDLIGGGDTIAPQVSINSPANSTLNTSTPRLNLTITEPNIDRVWVSIDGGQNISYAYSNGTIDFGFLDLIFADDFDRYQNGSNASPTWTNLPQFASAVIDNKTYKLYNETALIDALASLNGFSQLDYWASVSVMVPNGTGGGAYLTPRFGDVNNKYEIALDYDFSSININKAINGNWSNLVALWTGDLPTPVFVSKNEWHLLGSRVKGNNISAYVDEQLALNITDSDLNNATYSGLSLIAFDDVGNHTAYFDNLEVHKELGYGSHTLTVYANDTTGNVNSTSVTFFVGVDSFLPQFSNLSESPSNGTSYVQNQFYEFNITIIEPNIATVKINFNGINYTNVYARGGGIYSFNRTDLVVGNYVYYWWANDSFGNSNSSETKIYTIIKATPSLNLSVTNVTYPSDSVINASENNNVDSDLTYNLFINGVLETSGSTINLQKDLAAGNYTIEYNTTGGQNYTSNSIIKQLIITKALSEVNTYLNNSRSNASIFVGDSIYLNSTLVFGQGIIELYLNGSLINSGISPLSNFTTFNSQGLFNVTTIYPGNQNYTSSSETWWVNVTQIQNSPPIVHSNNTLVNGTIKTPEFGDNFIIQVNVSDPENDTISYVNFTITSPNGTIVVNNVKGQFFTSGIYSIWNSTNYTIDDYGTWNWSYVLSDGTNLVNKSGSFRVFSELFIFPASYVESPDPYNKTLIWNLSLYHLSSENYTLNFSFSINQTYFNLTLEKNSVVTNKALHNSSNLFRNLVTVEINSSIPVGSYLGNINITRQEDGKVFIVPIEIGINPPSGNIDAFEFLSGVRCLSGNCDINTEMENDESQSFSWKLKNIGNFSLTQCIPNITGFSVSKFGGFSNSNFNLSVSEELTLTLNINKPTINSYYGELEIVCKATSLGFNTSLGAERENVPGLNIIVLADSGQPPSSGGGGSSGGGSSGGGGSIVTPLKTELYVENISSIIVNKGGVKKIVSWRVKNTGTTFLNDCTFSSKGTLSSWVTHRETKGLAAGEEYDFIFDVNIPENIGSGEYIIDVSLTCKEKSKDTSFIVEVINKELDLYLDNINRESPDSVKVDYTIEEFSGKDHDVSLQFLLFDADGKQVSELNEARFIKASSKESFQTFLNIDETLEGQMTLLVNFNSDTYSGFVQENTFLGRSISGFTILDRIGGSDNIVSVALIILFLVFTFFVVRSIRNKKKSTEIHVRKMIRHNMHNKENHTLHRQEDSAHTSHKKETSLIKSHKHHK